MAKIERFLRSLIALSGCYDDQSPLPQPRASTRERQIQNLFREIAR